MFPLFNSLLAGPDVSAGASQFRLDKGPVPSEWSLQVPDAATAWNSDLFATLKKHQEDNEEHHEHSRVDRRRRHRRMAGRTHHRAQPRPPHNLIVGVVGAFIGGIIFSSLLGFRYDEGFNLPSIVVATVGAVVLLAVTGGFRQRRTLP